MENIMKRSVSKKNAIPLFNKYWFPTDNIL
jgi:hypothetical protein